MGYFIYNINPQNKDNLVMYSVNDLDLVQAEMNPNKVELFSWDQFWFFKVYEKAQIGAQPDQPVTSCLSLSLGLSISQPVVEVLKEGEPVPMK